MKEGIGRIDLSDITERKRKYNDLTDSFGKCEQCGKQLDLLSLFVAHKVCGKCCRKNHKSSF